MMGPRSLSLKHALAYNPERNDDVYPTLIASRSGQVVAICDLERCWGDDRGVLRDIVAILAADDVVLIVEGFLSLDQAHEPPYGPLADRHRRGDPTLSAALEVLRMMSNGDASHLLVPYRYDDGFVVWGDAVQVGPPGASTRPIELDGGVREIFDGRLRRRRTAVRCRRRSGCAAGSDGAGPLRLRPGPVRRSGAQCPVPRAHADQSACSPTAITPT